MVGDIAQAIAACDALAPEHLQLSVRDPEAIRDSLSHYGAVFVGEGSAEVFGDYGVGPNHVLPTGGTARFSGGLSVFTFLRVRTWLHIDPSDDIIADAAGLARLEGLEGHARAAERRGKRAPSLTSVPMDIWELSDYGRRRDGGASSGRRHLCRHRRTRSPLVGLQPRRHRCRHRLSPRSPSSHRRPTRGRRPVGAAGNPGGAHVHRPRTRQRHQRRRLPTGANPRLPSS